MCHELHVNHCKLKEVSQMMLQTKCIVCVCVSMCVIVSVVCSFFAFV